jgi:hypothetical protein
VAITRFTIGKTTKSNWRDFQDYEFKTVNEFTIQSMFIKKPEAFNVDDDQEEEIKDENMI